MRDSLTQLRPKPGNGAKSRRNSRDLNFPDPRQRFCQYNDSDSQIDPHNYGQTARLPSRPIK
jgi:hypothetical protein